ncbi:MAG: DNA repair protein RecN [Cyanobacteria bacterium QS_8_64_29]|nr:MAG: DNA repair protein RecN [Cyanobacteria bacterium QS_8_64_29]
MLLSLRIHNFALIDELELAFGPGLNVLTGETGAGKSIVLDALDAALGGKLTSGLLRAGCKRASIEATFQATPAAEARLQQQGIALLEGGNICCRRELTLGRNGLRSRARINGAAVNRQLVVQLRPKLLDVTAQGQTTQLASEAAQRTLLDGYGDAALQQQKATVASAYQDYRHAYQAWAQRQQSQQQRQQRIDWLQQQCRELAEAALSDPAELEQLERDRERLAHAVELQQLGYRAYQALYQSDSGDPTGTDLLGEAESQLSAMAQYDAQIEPVLEMVRGALNQAVEAGRQIGAYTETLETDPERLNQIEARIRTLKQICRKYGPTLAEAIERARNLQAELDELTASGQSLAELEQAVAERHAALQSACRELSQQRQAAAHQLEAQLVRELEPLAMDKVRFRCWVEAAEPSASGADRVTFAFSPNPGEPLQPLAETASGGEMNRFLLALKACFSHAAVQAGTLVFDEIDTGVSGRVASAIADKLHQLGQRHQVLCVTHQPLVAAMADWHFRVDKHVTEAADGGDGARTAVRVTPLQQPDGRCEELAQLAGGRSAQEAMAFARSLLEQAAHRRE